MAVQIPPWLQIDPIAPARIRLQANQQRNAVAAQERAAQGQAAELQFRREQAAAQQSAQERAAQRREQVFQQTQDQELAQSAQQMQLRRESQAQKADQFKQTLRLKQQKAEAESKAAAQQMQGMQAVQKGLEAGEPLQKLLAANATNLFPGRADRAFGALQRGIPKGVEGPPTAINVRDESGNPTGIIAVPGSGGMNIQRPQGLTARDRMMADRALLGSIMSQLSYEPENKAELVAEAKAIQDRLKKYATQGPATAPVLVPRPVATNSPPSAPASFVPGATTQAPVSAPTSDTVRVKSPDGKTGVIPRAQLEIALEQGYEEVGAAAEESEPTPEDEEEE